MKRRGSRGRWSSTSIKTRRSSAGYAMPKETAVLESYIGSMISRFQRVKKSEEGTTKIVVDCANGPGELLVTPRVLEALGHDVISLNAQISWRFPRGCRNRRHRTSRRPRRSVAGCGAGFGFAHDGDADRLVMIKLRRQGPPRFLGFDNRPEGLGQGQGIGGGGGDTSQRTPLPPWKKRRRRGWGCGSSEAGSVRRSPR